MNRSERHISYYDAVDQLNNLGGLNMYFLHHGRKGTEGMQHIDRIISGRQFVLSEAHLLGKTPLRTPLTDEITRIARQKDATIIPANYTGDTSMLNDGLPGFRAKQAISILNKRNLTKEDGARFEQIQQIREMRAVMGSLALFATMLRQNPQPNRPVSIWGLQHASSLPDMYYRIGVHPVDVTHLDESSGPIIRPHAHGWSDEQLQNVFEAALGNTTTQIT